MTAFNLPIESDKDRMNKESVRMNINMSGKFFTIEKMRVSID
jgi:hypothetical protein